MKKKLLENKKTIIIIISIILMILVIRASYAFYIFTKDTYDIVYNTGKIRIQLGDLSDGITLNNQLPISDEEGINQETSYSFTVNGYTQINKPIYYRIVAISGGTVPGKTRFDDEDVKLYLTDDEDNILYGPDAAYRMSSLGINMYENSIEGGSILAPVTHNYKLKLWINDENILISRTTTSTTKKVYTPEAYNSRYFSVKIKVDADIDGPKYPGQNIVDVINTDLVGNLYTPSGDNDQTFIVGTASDANYKPNNYLWYSGKLWRIVALNKTDGVVTSIKLVTQNSITTYYWNGTTENGGSGGTTYENSFLYQWLNEDFYDTLRNPTNYLVSDYLWNASSSSASIKPGNTIMVPGMVGLLNMYEFGRSSVNTTYANGYLNNGYDWWTITASGSNIYYVTSTGSTSNVAPPTVTKNIRPSIVLKTNINVVAGTGTSSDPYRLAGDNDQESDLVNEYLNTRYSGEYVKFNGENYRIVNIENNKTKIVKVDFLTDSSETLLTKAIGTTYLYSPTGTTSYWGGYLNNTTSSGWYGNLTEVSKNMIEEGTWYLGMVPSANSYKLSICASVETIANGGTKTSNCTRTTNTVTAKVALLRLGEMFASRMPSNRDNSSDMRLITPSATTGLHEVNMYGSGGTTATSTLCLARPALYLKSSVKIESGDGTPNKPFTINDGVSGGDNDYNSTKGVNKPKLAQGMTPVKWNGSDMVTTTENDPDWYDYTNKKWANAKTLDGSLWVWIPRYAYQIATLYHTDWTPGTINIKFLISTTDTTSDGTTISASPSYSGQSQTNFVTHPAFNFGDTKVTGIWVAKFEASGTASAVESKPNAISLRSMINSEYFLAARNMETNSRYGWGTSGAGIDTHMMKNTEWGAVAYLTLSSYGRGTDPIWINPANNYTTGCAGDSADSSSTTGCLRSYETINGVKASTTSNIYGIYDMRGGAHDATAAYINNGSDLLGDNNSNIVNAELKYKDVYSVGNPDSRVNNYNLTSSKFGDGIWEVSEAGSEEIFSWYGSWLDMPNGDDVCFRRGGRYDYDADSGLFTIEPNSGYSSSSQTFRPVLMVKEGL